MFDTRLHDHWDPPRCERSWALVDRMCGSWRVEARAAADRLVAIGELFELRRAQRGEQAEWAVDTWAAVGAEVAALVLPSFSSSWTPTTTSGASSSNASASGTWSTTRSMPVSLPACGYGKTGPGAGTQRKKPGSTSSLSTATERYGRFRPRHTTRLTRSPSTTWTGSSRSQTARTATPGVPYSHTVCFSRRPASSWEAPPETRSMLRQSR